MRVTPAGAAACVVALSLATAPAEARVVAAETILPPGQSGFVSLTGVADGIGSSHLYDQVELYNAFRWKPALFGRAQTSRISPKDGVRIWRDAYGVPTVDADTEADMWFGAGYAVAQDRLFQLDLFRHATQGRLSEIVGRSYLDDDRIVRRDYYTSAELDAMFAGLPAPLQQRIRDYAAGINAYIDTVALNPLAQPAETTVTTTPLRHWTPRDTVAVGVYLARTIPTNADPESVELSNMRGAQLGGAKALNALVPLHPARQVATIPASAGRFPSQPGRTRRHERRALRRSLAFVKDLPYPSSAAILPPRVPRRPALAPRVGGSYMFAARRRDGRTFLYNGPQLGYDSPEKLLEIELHAPGIHLHGMTAAGAPIIGAGYNEHVAWGVTTGASDADDLYAERLVPGEPEKYYFRGEVRTMDCRDETLRWQAPPSDAIGGRNPTDAGSRVVRVCRTVHGPVQHRAGNIAYARRYAAWKRELETIVGLAAINAARSVFDVDRAMRDVTWNENVMAADDAGHIGFWHPGLLPVRPRGWDERLPYPGDGRAEWRGLLPAARMPRVIDPRQRWLSNWNNVPSAGWSSGDGTARRRMDGPFFRAAWLAWLVRDFAEAPSLDAMKRLLRASGTVAQQLPLAKPRLRRAARGAQGPAKVVLDVLVAWDGSYARADANGTVDPGVAAWRAFRAAAARRALAPFGAAAEWLARDDRSRELAGGYHPAADYHRFDASHAESHALATLRPGALRLAAAAAHDELVKRFSSSDPARWREPREMYEIGAVGATSPPAIPFVDRGTFEQLVELGP